MASGARHVTHTSVLTISGLSIERGGFPLFKALDLEVPRQSRVMIVADNGVGKTSLLRTLAGLASVAEGRFDWHIAARDLRFLGHQSGLKAALSLRDNLAFWFAQDQTQVTESQWQATLQQFHLWGHEDQACAGLSAGQRRRAALMRLALSPGQCWLLDEPFANLDNQGIALVADLIDRHIEAGGTVLLSSHGKLPIAMQVVSVPLVPA